MRRGVIFGLSANLLWGLFPLYWPLLEPAGAVEILAHRMFWSAVTMALVVTVIRRWGRLRALPARTWGLIAMAAVLISINWGVYIFAVNNGHVVDASLGYFINPLVSVTLGVLLLHERLRGLQWAALGVAVPAVVITAAGAGQFPWLALVLAFTFGLYGLIKRVIRIPAVLSLSGESGVLALPALGYLIWLGATGHGHFSSGGWGHAVLLAGSGVVTAVPLLLFGAAARRLPLTVLGFLQYVTPVTQFLLGVLWAGEHMAPLRWAGFAMIWASLGLLSVDAVRRSRRPRATAQAGSNPPPDNPATDDTATNDPVTNGPATNDPSLRHRPPHNPRPNDTATNDPVLRHRPADNPTTDNPATNNPVTNGPATNNPSLRDRPPDNPATDNPPTGNPPADNPPPNGPTSNAPAARGRPPGDPPVSDPTRAAPGR